MPNRTKNALCILALALAWGCGSDPSNDDAAGGASGSGSGSGTGAKSGSGGTGGKGGGSGSGGASTGGTSTGGATGFVGQSRADSGSTDAVSGSAHVAVAPDGTLYVTWATESGAVVVAQSKDGGQSFEAPVEVQNTVKPLVSMARHPYVAATDTRVAVAFNDQDGTLYVYDSAAGTLAFGSKNLIGTEIASDFRDFPKPTFLGGQDLAVIWHGYPSTGARIFLARESAAFKSEEVSGGAPGVPCECCPNDILETSGGNVVVAFRNNEANIREMWSAQASGSGAFSKWAAISGSEGMVMSCPMQGPRLAEVGSNLVAVWSSRGGATAGRVYGAISSDGGSTWSPSEAVGDFQADEPTIAVGASGRIFVTGVTGSSKSALVTSDDGGKSWSSPEPLVADDGDLEVPQAQGTSGVAALAAVSTAGSVWFRRME